MARVFVAHRIQSGLGRWGRGIAALPVAMMGALTPALAADILYEYDALGRVVKVTYPSGQVITYTYDAAGNITNITVTP